MINKIDLPHANVAHGHSSSSRTSSRSPPTPAILASAKEGHRHRGYFGGDHSRAFHAPKPTAGQNRCRRWRLIPISTRYKGVVTHVRVFNGELKPGMQVQAAALRQERGGEGGRKLQSRSPTPRAKLQDGRDRLLHGEHQEPGGGEDGRHDHGCAQSLGRTLPGIPRDSPDGVQRHLPDQHGGLRGI